MYSPCFVENAVKERVDYTKKENVNHPEHYKSGQYECIDVMKDIWGVDAVITFCKLNAFKYLWRADKKNGSEDISKAKWYLDKAEELELEKEN